MPVKVKCKSFFETGICTCLLPVYSAGFSNKVPLIQRSRQVGNNQLQKTILTIYC